jgi:hypothetical protein
VGDEKSTPFWEARWLHEAAPKDITPSLFKNARFKSRTITKEPHNSSWIKNIGDVNSPELLQEYVLLYTMLSSITLDYERDQILWRWSAHGKYTVKSAYDCQFVDSLSYFLVTHVWKAKNGA